MKKILFLSFYLRPDLCAGSFRNSPLLDELAVQAEQRGIGIDAFTTMPQRYKSFTQEAPEREEQGNLRIERVRVPLHKSGMKDQAQTFRAYFNEVRKRTRAQQYDLVYASSSRLFTAYLGYRIASARQVPLYLDIRDIFVDTINEVVKNRLVKLFALPVLKIVEQRTFGYAAHINLISEGFKPYFEAYTRGGRSCFTNGIDEVFIEAARETPARNGHARRRTIVYAGNMGEGQGLHKVVPQAARLLGDGYEFRMIGDGGARQALVEQIRALDLQNVIVKDPVNRETLIREYRDADYLFIHLNDYEAFKKVLPSKIFELGVFRKPIVAGVAGHAHEFLARNLPGTILFAPGDYQEMVRQLQADTLDRPIPDRADFITGFRRDLINARMAESILSYVK
jgi:glycosyltransferase involved in cell wall biosynthesis